jgi:uncharacterized YigZ family protein
LLTLSSPVSDEIYIKKSHFVSHASPVDNQPSTLDFYEQVADPAATHNCWAWKIEPLYRFNDDGEPASTAGKPILAAIEGKQLSHVMVVVTRYFGGIKLGVGGLIRAYSGSASRCIDRGELIEVFPTSVFALETGFEWTGPVHLAIEACGASKISEQFTAAGIRLEVEVRDDRVKQLQTQLRDATRGKASLKRV